MLRKCIRDIIEPIGFVNEGDITEERWVAQFRCDCTGNILTFVAQEVGDETGVSRILFNVSDETGQRVNTVTLDQLLMSFEQEMEMVPRKSHKVYIGVCNLHVQVPVDMNDVSYQTYNDIIRDGYTSEVEIADQCVRQKLREAFCNTDMNLLHFDIQQIKC